MSNSQLEEIDASIQAIVRRAYELGRGDALKKVVDVLNADKPGVERLALMAPDTTDVEAGPHLKSHTLNGQEAVSSAPWWAWPVR